MTDKNGLQKFVKNTICRTILHYVVAKKNDAFFGEKGASFSVGTSAFF